MRKTRRRNRRNRRRRKTKIPRAVSLMNPKNSVIVQFKDIELKSQTSDFIVYNRQMKLNDYDKYSNWTKLFSQYRVIGITVKYIPSQTEQIGPLFSDETTGESANLNPRGGAPRLFSRDNRSGETSIPTSVDDMYLEGWNVRDMKHGQNRIINIKRPNTLALASESSGDTQSTTPQYGKYFATQDPDVYYQGGIQAVVANATVAFPYKYHVLRTITVQFRNLDYNPLA